MKENLIPYQKIIDKVNAEFGASIKIPEGDEKEIYNNLSKIPLEKFEQDLRLDYLKATKEFSKDIIITQEENSSALPRGATLTNQTQVCYFNNGIVGIDAQVSVDTSSAIVKYSRITRTFSRQPASGNYFKTNPKGSTVTISSDFKKATVSYKGNLYSQSSLVLLSNRSVTVTYTAGGGDIYGSFQIV